MTYLLTNGGDTVTDEGTVSWMMDILWNTSLLYSPTAPHSLSHVGPDMRGLDLSLSFVSFNVGEITLGFYLFLQSERKKT